MGGVTHHQGKWRHTGHLPLATGGIQLGKNDLAGPVLHLNPGGLGKTQLDRARTCRRSHGHHRGRGRCCCTSRRRGVHRLRYHYRSGGRRHSRRRGRSSGNSRNSGRRRHRSGWNGRHGTRRFRTGSRGFIGTRGRESQFRFFGRILSRILANLGRHFLLGGGLPEIGGHDEVGDHRHPHHQRGTCHGGKIPALALARTGQFGSGSPGQDDIGILRRLVGLQLGQQGLRVKVQETGVIAYETANEGLPGQSCPITLLQRLHLAVADFQDLGGLTHGNATIFPGLTQDSANIGNDRGCSNGRGRIRRELRLRSRIMNKLTHSKLPFMRAWASREPGKRLRSIAL